MRSTARAKKRELALSVLGFKARVDRASRFRSAVPGLYSTMGPSKYLNLELLQLRMRLACAAQRFMLSTPAVTVWQCHLWVNGGLNSCCPSNSDQLSSTAPKALCKNAWSFTTGVEAGKYHSVYLCLILITICLQWQSSTAPPALQPCIVRVQARQGRVITMQICACRYTPTSGLRKGKLNHHQRCEWQN